MQAVDLSVLGAQAIAQVERARKTAAANLAAAMQHRPRLLLRAALDAPKIAIPVPASEDDQGKPLHVAPAQVLLVNMCTAVRP